MARRRRKKLPADPKFARIDALSHDGRGVAHLEGKTTFIHGALPGEEVHFLYSAQRSTVDEGVAVEIIKPAPERVEPKCPHFSLCGGCSLQHLDSARQVEMKEGALLDALSQIGKVAPEVVLPPLRPEQPWGYRRKARLGVKRVAKKGKVLVGFRERNSRFVADLSRCEVLHPRVGEKLEALSALIDGLSIAAQIPQIEVAMGDEVCVLIFRLLEPASEADRTALLAFGVEHQFEIWEQRGGPETVKPMAGEPADLLYRLPDFGLELHFLPTDFTQVNSDLNRQMVARAVALLDPQPQERILDLFCGLGNFTLPLARRAGEVVGVEGDAGLVERGRRNAERNGLTNVRYFTANLYDSLEHEPWRTEQFSGALLDPPRSGAAEVLELLPELGVERILYVSCHPATLARDAGELVHRHHYRLLSAGVMDMFPHTAHTESIALFER